MSCQVQPLESVFLVVFIPAQSKWRTAVGKPLQSQYHAIPISCNNTHIDGARSENEMKFDSGDIFLSRSSNVSHFISNLSALKLITTHLIQAPTGATSLVHSRSHGVATSSPAGFILVITSPI